MFKRLKRFLLCLAALGSLLAACYLFRAPLLRGAAAAWVTNDHLDKADAIVVLGGGPETRSFEAARLYHQGLAPVILLMNPKLTPSQELGLAPSESELERRILNQKQVPDTNIVTASDIVTSTYEESLSVRKWAKTNAIKRVIIPDDVFHMRRVRWLFCKQLKTAGIQVEVEAVPVREYALTDWWQHAQGVVAFQNEVLKYAYYRVKY